MMILQEKKHKHLVLDRHVTRHALVTKYDELEGVYLDKQKHFLVSGTCLFMKEGGDRLHKKCLVVVL